MPFILQLHRLNAIVALGAGTITYGWSHFLHVQISFSFALWVSLAVLCIYSGHRIYKCERNHSQPEINVWYKQNRGVVKGIFVLSLILSLVLLEALNFTLLQFLILCVGLLLSIWYVVPIFSFRLREISLLKAPLVALVWTGILVVFPQLKFMHITLDFLAYALAFFCYFLALTIPFDVRDLSLDETTQDTIPIVLGIGKSRWLAVLLLIVSILIIAKFNQNSWLMFLLIPSYMITAVFIFATKEDRKDVFYAGLDATMVPVGFAFYMVS